MLNDSFAPAKRALLFFGCMASAVAVLTFGAGLQIPTDQSSTTVAMARSDRSVLNEPRIASVDRSDRSESAAKRAIPSPSQQAMADGGRVSILR